jgi:hypothetical protein
LCTGDAPARGKKPRVLLRDCNVLGCPSCASEGRDLWNHLPDDACAEVDRKGGRLASGFSVPVELPIELDELSECILAGAVAFRFI